MRRRALESDVIIVNHHLFFADMAIKQQAKAAPDAGVLPEAAAVIFDEAHELEDVASSYFGITLSNVRLEELVRDMETMLSAKHAHSSGLKGSGEMLRERARMFFAALPRGGGQGEGRMPFEQREQFLEEHGDVYLGVMNALYRLEGELDGCAAWKKRWGSKSAWPTFASICAFFWRPRALTPSSGSSAEVAPSRQGGTQYLLAGNTDRCLRALSRIALREDTQRDSHLGDANGAGGFAHLRKRLGLVMRGSWWCLRISAIRSRRFFTCRRKCRTLANRLLPSKRRAAYGGCWILLAAAPSVSLPAISKCATCMSVFCRSWIIPCLLQGSAPRKALLEEFRTTPNAVLFGTSSFWQGVDVQGEALSCVIVDRLPFAVPTDPVVAARMRAIEDSGANPFFEYQVPSAVITLKQGFGRLIRSLEDRGLLVLLDPRIQRQRYGQVFLESLPPYRLTQDIAEVERFFADG